jgi:hypothetical protein
LPPLCHWIETKNSSIYTITTITATVNPTTTIDNDKNQSASAQQTLMVVLDQL